MNCPTCGTGNYYQGLMRGSCMNPSCKEYDPVNSVSSSANQGGWPAGSVNSIAAPSNPYHIVGGQAIQHPTTYQGAIVIPQVIRNQQQPAMDVLGELEKHHPDALVSGGAPRNWQYDMEAKDIDIFLAFKSTAYGPRHVEMPQALSSLRWHLNNLQVVGGGISTQYPSPQRWPGIRQVWEFEYKSIKFNIIEIFNPKLGSSMCAKDATHQFNVETFDCGLCKISWDRTGIYFRSQEFNEDYIHSHLTFNMTDYIKSGRDPHDIIRRSQKLQSYFPNHKLRLI